MRVVGVIDLRRGQAVHARGGRREAYAPLAEAAGSRVDGDAIRLARVYVDTLGVRELYVADLDAIEHGVPSSNEVIVHELVSLGVPVWLDAGVHTPLAARRVLDDGAARVIVGLETLSDVRELDVICAVVGGGRVAFSIDLRDGVLVAKPNVAAELRDAARAALRAASAGAGSVIVLDLARVGSGSGIDLESMSVVRAASAHVELFAGGGVRNAADLRALESLGCNGALVASALISGAIRRTELESYRRQRVTQGLRFPE